MMREKTFGKRINWKVLITAFFIICLAFSFNAIAQIDSGKPLDAKSLTVLVEELKGVVSRSEPDEKKSAMVAAKWDKRRDLSGKTKEQVINLLYEDVKKVITDSGTQYEISSIFSLYKQIPDEQFSGNSESKQINSLKKETVVKLVDLVFASHPYVNIEKELKNLPGTRSGIEADGKQRFEVFNDALKVNKKLTPDQKAFVKTNYDRLSRMIDEKIDTTMKLNYPTERWVQEGLEKIFAARFTVEEVNNLTAFFASDKGAQVLNYVRQTNMEQLITGNGGKLDFTAADRAEHDKFAATALGKKFLAAYVIETEAFEQKKESEVRSSVPNADGLALLESDSLNKFFNRFVTANYKKQYILKFGFLRKAFKLRKQLKEKTNYEKHFLFNSNGFRGGFNDHYKSAVEVILRDVGE